MMNDDDDVVRLTPDEAEKLVEYASEFNMTIQGGFIEMMRKMHAMHLGSHEGRVLIGNYGPLSLGAAIAAIIERYDSEAEEEFWSILMRKYAEGRQVLAGAMDDPEAAEERGAVMVDAPDTTIPPGTTKH